MASTTPTRWSVGSSRRSTRTTRPSTAEFRRYTEGDLKTAKIDQAGAILAALPGRAGGEVRLDAEAAEAWLRALNDARLAMGVRLEIKDGTDLGEELDDAVAEDPGPRPGCSSCRSTPTSDICRSRCSTP